MSKIHLIDPVSVLKKDVGELIIKREQHIPQEFLDDIRREREDSIQTPTGEMYRAARIPTAVIDKWDREGFDYNRAPVRDILAKLRKEHLDAFITTKKRI